MTRTEQLREIAAKRKKALERYTVDPFAYIFEAVRTKDEHDSNNPIKQFPRKDYSEKLLDIWHNGEDVEFLIKSRQLMVSWLAVAYLSWVCRFNPHRLAFVQSKKEEDAANLVYNKHASIGRLSFIETHLPKWLQQDIDWSYGTAIYPNGSKVWAIPQGPQHYEGYVPSIVFNDEASLQDKWEQGHAALKPCIEGGAKCITVATVRMPMPYSVEMSNFNKEEADILADGFWRFESRSGASAHALHYSADPDKNPATEKGLKWYNKAIKGYVGGTESYLWRQHMEIDFEAIKGTKLIPFWPAVRENAVIDPIPISEQIGWRYYAGFDYGKRNHTVLGVYAVDQFGNRYIVDEIAAPGEKLGGIPGIAARIKNSPYYEKIRANIKADPSIWNENQAKQKGGYTSIRRLFASEGISLKKAPIKGTEADQIAMERLLYNYWGNECEEPTLYIFRNCKVHLKQFKGLRYRDFSEAIQLNKALNEELIDRDNDTWDAWKYAEAARPAPSILTRKPVPGSFMDVRDKYLRAASAPRGIRRTKQDFPFAGIPIVAPK